MRSALSPTSRRRAWQQAGPISRTVARSNCRRRSTNSKWGVEPNQEEIGKIRQEVGTAPWLKLKRIRRVSDLPLQIPTAPTDRIGALYNHVRKELYEFFADVRPLEDFRGAICGGTYDRDMLKEAGVISTVYAVNIGLLAEKRHAYEDAVAGSPIEAGRLPDLEGKRFEGGCQ